MKLTGYCNLFVRKVEKDGKVFSFPEISVSSKDKEGNFKNLTLKVTFKKDLVDVEELEEGKCYNIEVTDSIVNIVHDDYLERNVMTVFINDFDFVKTIPSKQTKQPKITKKLPK